jgi:hypothetical protein
MGAGSKVESKRYMNDYTGEPEPKLKLRQKSGIKLHCENPNCQRYNTKTNERAVIEPKEQHYKLGKHICCLDCKP